MFFQFMHCYPVWIQRQAFFFKFLPCGAIWDVTADIICKLAFYIFPWCDQKFSVLCPLLKLSAARPCYACNWSVSLNLLINHCTRQWCHTWQSQYISSNSCLTSVYSLSQQNMSHQKPLHLNWQCHLHNTLSSIQAAHCLQHNWLWMHRRDYMTGHICHLMCFNMELSHSQHSTTPFYHRCSGMFYSLCIFSSPHNTYKDPVPKCIMNACIKHVGKTWTFLSS
jgi:hypothetical protein